MKNGDYEGIYNKVYEDIKYSYDVAAGYFKAYEVAENLFRRHFNDYDYGNSLFKHYKSFMTDLANKEYRAKYLLDMNDANDLGLRIGLSSVRKFFEYDDMNDHEITEQLEDSYNYTENWIYKQQEIYQAQASSLKGVLNIMETRKNEVESND